MARVLDHQRGLNLSLLPPLQSSASGRQQDVAEEVQRLDRSPFIPLESLEDLLQATNSYTTLSPHC